jgi:hypothetical protein
MPMKRSYTWGTMRTGNRGKVQEECWEGPDLIYRKIFEMPANVVPSFVEGRRRCVAMDMRERGNNYTNDDSGGVH